MSPPSNPDQKSHQIIKFGTNIDLSDAKRWGGTHGCWGGGAHMGGFQGHPWGSTCRGFQGHLWVLEGASEAPKGAGGAPTGAGECHRNPWVLRRRVTGASGGAPMGAGGGVTGAHG